VQLAGALPERVSHLALIDGVIPPTVTEQDAAERLGMALQAQLRLDGKRKTVYATLEEGVEARMKGMVAVSREAAELLAQRGLMPVPGGYSWRSDSRLTLPSPTRLNQAQAMAFVKAWPARPAWWWRPTACWRATRSCWSSYPSSRSRCRVAITCT
jgi:hypothetical protein